MKKAAAISQQRLKLDIMSGNKGHISAAQITQRCGADGYPLNCVCASENFIYKKQEMTLRAIQEFTNLFDFSRIIAL